MAISVLLSIAWLTGRNSHAAGLPSPEYTEWTTEKDIFIPMRDGIHLDTDVWQPKGATGKLPTILVSTPYDKDKIENQLSLGWVEFFVKHGYAVVVQSQRGRYFSEGEFNHYLDGASTDGYDTVEWITQQPWSNGKVGATGCSASSDVQWPIAASNPPAFGARVTVAGGEGIGTLPGDETRGAFYRGGVPSIGFWAPWYRQQATTERLLLPPHSSQEQRTRLRQSYSLIPSPDPASDESVLSHLPSKDILRAEGRALTPFDHQITWTPADARWNDMDLVGAGAKPTSPALLVETWYDDSVMETARMFKYLQDQGATNQYLIIGPGPHCTSSFELMVARDLEATTKAFASSGQSEIKVSDLRDMAGLNLAHFKVGDLEVGDARYRGEDLGYAKLYLQWLDHWLKGVQNGVAEMPRVQLYVTGKGWIFGDQWPLKGTRFTNYYLTAGTLSTSASKISSKDRYRYDPSDPTPSKGGNEGTPGLDQRPIEARKDVLVYSTAPLERSVTVAGPVEVVLYISSSAKDTDFMVKLVDVFPDGKAIDLNSDAFRMRYREGFDKKVVMEPGQVYKITLPNMVTGTRFAKGHRIRLDITSSDFPNRERNLNTGGNNYDETTWVVADNRVHHGPQHPSHIVLPVLPD